MLWHKRNISAVWVEPLHHQFLTLVSKVDMLPPFLEI